MTGTTPVTSPTTNVDSSPTSSSENTRRNYGGSGSAATWVKSDRLLLEGRLRMLLVDGNLIVAECRGDSGRIYNQTHAAGRWTCDCPARADCSHLRALWRVVAL